MKITTTLKWAAVSAAFISIALPSFGQLIVANAALREEIRQQTEWTDENISKYPYLFIQDQIRKCDDLKAKIEAQTVTLTPVSYTHLRAHET